MIPKIVKDLEEEIDMKNKEQGEITAPNELTYE